VVGTVTVGATPEVPAGRGLAIAVKLDDVVVVVVDDVVVVVVVVDDVVVVGIVATWGELFEKRRIADPANKATTITEMITFRLSCLRC
jgi:hypothetical protein